MPKLHSCSSWQSDLDMTLSHAHNKCDFQLLLVVSALLLWDKGVEAFLRLFSSYLSWGADETTDEILLACGHKLFSILAPRFSRYLTQCEVPSAWKSSKTILLFQKGDWEDLSSYRPLTLLPVLYKVFTKCLLSSGRQWKKRNRWSRHVSDGSSAPWITYSPAVD